MLERVFLSRQARGFTIIELAIVVMIVAVLASLAAPSFRSFMINQRVKTASFDLYSTLLFARSEAIKRPAGNLLITPTNASNWADGWSVTFGTVVLRQQDAMRDISISGPASIQFGHNGRPSAAVIFSLNATGFSGITGRCVSANPSGGLATKIQPAGGC
jgi:type IV fimbrial biogenesis protein FimT